MNNSDTLTPNESLEILSKAIGQARENFKEDSFYFILWGWIVVFASLLNYYLLEFTDYANPYVSWLIFVPIGWIATGVYATRAARKQKFQSYLDSYMSTMWAVLGVAFVLAVFLSLSVHADPSSFTLLIAGVGTLVSGFVMKFRPFIFGGIVLWIFAIATLYVDDSQKLLLTAAAVILGYIVPAYILKRS